MDRLSGLDASFLYLETPAQLLHVCGVIVLDPETVPGGYEFGEFKDELERRIEHVPMFHRKLKQVPLGIDHPVWVNDDDFDIDRHVHRMALPVTGRRRASWPSSAATWPGSRSTGAGRCGSSTSSRATGPRRARSARRLHQDAPLHRRRGLRRQRDLLPLLPRGRRAAARVRAEGRRAGRGPRVTSSCSAAACVTNLYKPVALAKVIGPTVKGVASTIGRAREGTAMPAPLTAPRTSFNGTITGHRSLAIGDMSLQKIKDVKNAVEGATVNDVVHRGQRGSAAALPRRARRAAGDLADRLRAGLGAREVQAPGRQQQGLDDVLPARHRRRGPARAAARGLADQPERQGAPQGDLGRLAAGLGPVRGPAHLRARRTPGLLAPAGRPGPGDPQPGDLQRPRPAGAALLHGRQDRSASTRSARSSTAPASTSP